MPLPFAGLLIQELDLAELDTEEPERSESSGRSSPPPSIDNTSILFQVGRFWNDKELDFLVEPEAWRKAFVTAGATLQQNPPRSVLVSGEPLVGKSSFLSLLAQKIAPDGWSVFEARGADLQADQIYIGQLEGRIRQVVDELAKARRTIWYIPDIVQLAMSGTHSGQSATILDQIIPAIAAGRLVVWAEASPKGMTRLLRINPSLRGLFETVTIEPMPADDTLSLTRGVMRQMEERANIRFEPDCAEVARDTVSHVMGSNALPGSVLLMLKLTVVRAEKKDDIISSRQILETLSQLSGLPLSILDTRERLDLAAIREFFASARDRPGRGGRGRRRSHRHAQGRPQRSGQADRRLSVRRTDRHRQDRARQDRRRISVRLGRAHDPPRHERISDARSRSSKILGGAARRHRGQLADQPRAQAAVLGACCSTSSRRRIR